MVKLFGAGGFIGFPSYGTGFLVSGDGHILTVATQMLETRDLRSPPGRRHAITPAWSPSSRTSISPCSRSKRRRRRKRIVLKTPDSSTWRPRRRSRWRSRATGVLAFSNQFKIATRDEPMSVQRGVVSAYSKLRGRRGVIDAPYNGEVYFVDAITNNPGAGGGALTNRKGKSCSASSARSCEHPERHLDQLRRPAPGEDHHQGREGDQVGHRQRLRPAGDRGNVQDPPAAREAEGEQRCTPASSWCRTSSSERRPTSRR